MPADHRNPMAPRAPLLAAARLPAAWAPIGLLLVLAVAVDLAPARAMAADTHVKVLRPAVNLPANATRKALIKQRSTVLGSTARHPGKTVGGAGMPASRTIVTKRFLPK